ncbi:MAG: hypothetical protein QOE12_1565 [Mycobacterium sp.]|nr:hypothetical protein [Mycobacterium sp.]
MCRAVGGGGDLPNRDGWVGVQPRTVVALHCHRADRCEHRPRAQGVRGAARLAAIRPRAGALRPQPRRSRHARRIHSLAVPARRRQVAFLRRRAHGLVARAHQDGSTTVVGNHDQRHLHVIFCAALHRRRRALAVQPNRVGSVRPPVRRAVIRRARGVRAAARRAAVGGGELHAGRCRWWPVGPAMHVSGSGECSRRRAAGCDADEPARRPPVRRADLHPRLGNAASAVGRGAARLRTGQREPGRCDSVATCRGDRDDLDVSVATGQTRLAPTAGGLPVSDGLRPGVLRRAFCRRHPVRLGARRGGVSGGEPR